MMLPESVWKCYSGSNSVSNISAEYFKRKNDAICSGVAVGTVFKQLYQAIKFSQNNYNFRQPVVYTGVIAVYTGVTFIVMPS